MKYTSEEIEKGVNVIRTCRDMAARDALNVTKVVELLKPKYRNHWSAALVRLGVAKKSRDGVILDRSYWNQAPYGRDYDLCVAVLEHVHKHYQNINKKYVKAARAKKNSDKTPFIKIDHLSMSFEEYKKLCADFSEVRVDDIVDRIRNYKGNKKYKSLYLTAKTWLNNDYRNAIPNYWEGKNGALNESEKKDVFDRLEKQRIKKDPLDGWDKSKDDAVTKCEPVVVQTKFIPNEPNEPKTKWLKIFGIKIYEKPIL